MKRLKEKAQNIRRDLGSGDPLLVGRSLTIIFGVLVVSLAVLPQKTDAGWNIRFFEFMSAPANEIGDTFAGLAGVMAFLWIIITVWLQSMELAEQRKELRATRTELKLTRETQQEQLKVLKAQGSIFLDEQTQRQELRENQVLNERIALLASKIGFFREYIFPLVKPGRYFSGDGGQFILKLNSTGAKLAMLPKLEDVSHQDNIYRVSLYLEQLQIVLAQVLEEKAMTKRASGEKYFFEILHLFSLILDSKERLSEADRYVIDRLRIKRTRRVLQEILALPIWEKADELKAP